MGNSYIKTLANQLETIGFKTGKRLIAEKDGHYKLILFGEDSKPTKVALQRKYALKMIQRNNLKPIYAGERIGLENSKNWTS